MTDSYQHWDDEQTARQMFGDQDSLCELVEAFLDQYEASLRILESDGSNLRQVADEVHTLRSLFGIFNARKGQAMAIAMDRGIRAGQAVSVQARQELIDELKAFADELKHFVSVHKP